MLNSNIAITIILLPLIMCVVIVHRAFNTTTSQSGSDEGLVFVLPACSGYPL